MKCVKMENLLIRKTILIRTDNSVSTIRSFSAKVLVISLNKRQKIDLHLLQAKVFAHAKELAAFMSSTDI